MQPDEWFLALRARVIAGFALGERSLHGPSHWARVERHGMLLAERSGADRLVVRLFALFHDSCREDEGRDPEHGPRGAALAASLRGTLYELDDARFALLHEACRIHNGAGPHADPTIGTCLDADRLDLWRVGITPDPTLMSTDHGRELAARRWRMA
ncbi:MAG: hypothetical protein NW201_11890 [Gemmatimonadales bacterium]|nr:hypothetical protein [Gemmatimonadales bacterium]